jgi:signal transduction histidine kinase
VVLVPGAAVGAVGVPVKLGDEIVARNAMSAILVVMLAVLDVTLVSNAAILFVFAVMLAVLLAIFVAFVLILAVFEVILAVFAAIFAVFVAIFVVFDVILAVLLAILVSAVVTLVGKFEIVDELTPPTELIVVGKVPVPLPVTSPVKVIN